MIGNIVRRAYAHNLQNQIGIIVDEAVEVIGIPNLPEDPVGEVHAYEDLSFIIAWSDGTLSTEMSVELVFCE